MGNEFQVAWGTAAYSETCRDRQKLGGGGNQAWSKNRETVENGGEYGTLEAACPFRGAAATLDQLVFA